ncbi:MAG: hypothetical protein ACXV2C_01070 [Candidatus Bathyarchaeia archaeon]
MGAWNGCGNWAWSYEEKREYKEKKRQQSLAGLAERRKETKKIFLNLTELKSFLNSKDIDKYFSKPSKEIKIKFGVMKLYKIEKVLSVIKKHSLQIKTKKCFEQIQNEEVKREVRCLELNQKLSTKEAVTTKIIKI